MPYYLYKVFPFHRLERVAEFAAFAEASAAAKQLRREPGLPADCRVRVMFANDVLGAETLLTEVREPQPRIDEDD
jgi:hypothetical protein